MKTIQLDYKNIMSNNEPISLCLGFFDGVHIGHKNLIEYARKNAKYKLGLLTFNQPISNFINNSKSMNLLTSLDDRFKIISKFGLDYYFILHIDKEFLANSIEDFINMLKKMNVQEVFVGDDYTFGKNKEGNVDTLRKYFKTNVIELVFKDNKKVSTQDICYYLSIGDIQNANRLLGYNYMISGVVVKGKQIGSKIGFPTMNIKTNVNYVLPKNGVYKTIAYVSNVPHISITNIGTRPTLGENNCLTIEVYLPEFNKIVYGESISLEFIKFIREERRFSSLDELKQQIEIDVSGLLNANKINIS